MACSGARLDPSGVEQHRPGDGRVLAVFLALTLGCSSSDAPRPAAQARPNVLLISLDTLRRDRVGAFEPGATTTPNLDRFAAKSLRFESAFTHHPWTLTAHATMLSGLYPSVHGVLSDRRLNDVVATMPEAFLAADYATIGVVSSCTWVAPAFGFDQGFGQYLVVEGNAGPKIDVLLEQVDSLEGQPFFGFLHLFDAHSDEQRLPYESSQVFREEYAGWYEGPFDGQLPEHPDWGHSSALLQRMNAEGAQLEGDERAYLAALYDAGVRTLDEELGRLFGELERRGLLENTLIAVVADHGEEFYEHGRALHEGQYDELIKIPFLLHGPRIATGSTRDFVGLVDLAPTLLDLAGLERPADMQGRSLLALTRGEDLAEPRDFVYLDNSMFLGLRSRTTAAIFGPDGVGLYDLEADPGELHNLADDPASAEVLSAIVERMKAERAAMAPLAERLTAVPGTVNLETEERAELHALGYTGD